MALLRRLVLTAGRHRRIIAALAAGGAVIATLSAVTAKPPAGVAVITAARDLPAGSVLASGDLRAVTLPVDAVPADAITSVGDAVGRAISGAVRRGEPLTDVRLENGPLDVPGAGLVAAPVRLADAQAAQLLQPGERIDVLAASTSTSTSTTATVTAAAVVAADVRVLAISNPTAAAAATGADLGDTGLDGALVVLATTPTQARELAQAQVSARLSAVVVG
jgi:Flp pilus assembly protein CpaB